MRNLLFRDDVAMRQHDAAGLWSGDSAPGLARGPRDGNQEVAGTPPHRRDGERGDECETEPAAVGAGAPPGRDRNANLRLQIYQQSGG